MQHTGPKQLLALTLITLGYPDDSMQRYGKHFLYPFKINVDKPIFSS